MKKDRLLRFLGVLSFAILFTGTALSAGCSVEDRGTVDEYPDEKLVPGSRMK